MRRDAGFTLAELLIVIVIIGILSAVAVPVLLSQNETAEQRALESDLTTVSSMLVTAKSFGYPLPASLPAGQVTDIQGVGTYTPAVTLQVVSTPEDVCVWGSTPDLTVTLSMSEVSGLQSGECTGSDTSGLEIEYPLTEFTTGSNLEVLSPTVAGASGDLTFTLNNGQLPPGVTLDPLTGDLTGPATSAWNFQAVQISIGLSHTCAVTSLGTAKCWGENTYGQLGDGTYASSGLPVDVVNPNTYEPFTDVKQVATGSTQEFAFGSFSCLVTTDGELWCWGNGMGGQLGNENYFGMSSEVPVFVGSGYESVSAGFDFACAVTTDGLAKCWGYNSLGQIGAGVPPSAATEFTTPQRVVDIAGVQQISAGGTHACAVAFGSQVWCWGDQSFGQLGDVEVVDPFVDKPIRAKRLPNGAEVVQAGYNFTCATSSGAVKCWGVNASGQMGNGTNTGDVCPNGVPDTCQTLPATVNGLTGGVVDLASGYDYSCAQRLSGQVVCWGDGTFGQLGDGTYDTALEPVNVIGVTPSVDFFLDEIGGRTAGIIVSGGAIRVWGDNSCGQFGNDVVVDATACQDFIFGSLSADSSNVPVGTVGAGPTDGFPATITIGVTDGVRSGSTTFTLTQTVPPL